MNASTPSSPGGIVERQRRSRAVPRPCVEERATAVRLREVLAADRPLTPEEATRSSASRAHRPQLPAVACRAPALRTPPPGSPSPVHDSSPDAACLHNVPDPYPRAVAAARARDSPRWRARSRWALGGQRPGTEPWRSRCRSSPGCTGTGPPHSVSGCWPGPRARRGTGLRPALRLAHRQEHPRLVKEMLGHSQMRTTMDTQRHVMPALAREAADRMRPDC